MNSLSYDLCYVLYVDYAYDLSCLLLVWFFEIQSVRKVIAKTLICKSHCQGKILHISQAIA